MHLESVITLANANVKGMFFAMERSLRSTGCNVPLRVIPYDDQRFELPENASWLEDAAVFAMLDKYGSHRMMRKYVCLLHANYCFVDTDVIFLRDPREALSFHDGFVANCTHWINTEHAMSQESERYFRSISSTYPKLIFNAGQFACDRPLFRNARELENACLGLPGTTLTFPFHDQPGLNYLVANSRIPYRNLTLPPYCIESSWAGHYLDLPFPPSQGTDSAPYCLHWAGLHIDGSSKIDNLFLSYVPENERAVFLRDQATSCDVSPPRRIRKFARSVCVAFKDSFLSSGALL